MITWRKITFLQEISINELAYNGDIYVGGSTGNNVRVSSDLADWTTVSMPARVVSVAYGNGVFVAGFSVNNGLRWSTDGMTWNSTNIPGNTARVVFDGTRFVAVLMNGTFGTVVVYESTDGATWSQIPGADFPGGNLGFQRLRLINGLYVVMYEGTNLARVSSDAVSWPAVSVVDRLLWHDGERYISSNGRYKQGAMSAVADDWPSYSYDGYSSDEGSGGGQYTATPEGVFGYTTLVLPDFSYRGGVFQMVFDPDTETLAYEPVFDVVEDFAGSQFGSLLTETELILTGFGFAYVGDFGPPPPPVECFWTNLLGATQPACEPPFVFPGMELYVNNLTVISSSNDSSVFTFRIFSVNGLGFESPDFTIGVNQVYEPLDTAIGCGESGTAVVEVEGVLHEVPITRGCF